MYSTRPGPIQRIMFARKITEAKKRILISIINLNNIFKGFNERLDILVTMRNYPRLKLFATH